MPEGLEDAAQYSKITDGLLGLGYPEARIAKILGENTLRVMEEAEQIAREMQVPGH
jgi:microsomal dipeptidase-like Zn-dependent dipeptidase